MLLIDNYDSFTYNLYQLICSIDPNIEVLRNDQIDIVSILELKPKALFISPGPGHPKDVPLLYDIITQLKGKIPILGICLGMQAMALAFNGEVIQAKNGIHGQSSKIYHQNSQILEGLDQGFAAARYHSLIVDPHVEMNELRVTAQTKDGVIMAIEHIEYPLYGVQFHPESILTNQGQTIIENFLNLSKKFNSSLESLF